MNIQYVQLIMIFFEIPRDHGTVKMGSFPLECCWWVWQSLASLQQSKYRNSQICSDYASNWQEINRTAPQIESRIRARRSLSQVETCLPSHQRSRGGLSEDGTGLFSLAGGRGKTAGKLVEDKYSLCAYLPGGRRIDGRGSGSVNCFVPSIVFGRFSSV